MREEDQPPQEIWLDPEAIEAHFQYVHEKYANSSSGDESVPDPSAWSDNELTKGLR